MVRKNLDQRPLVPAPRPEELLAQSGLTGTALVTSGKTAWKRGDIDAPFVIYSLTKPVISAAILKLAAERAVDLDAALPDGWAGGASVRQLLRHTAGVRDYGLLAEYHKAVRQSPSEPWNDNEFLRRALGSNPAPGREVSWAYSNTGYLLLRQIIDRHGGLASFLPGLGFTTATVAERLPDFGRAVPARSSLIGEGLQPVAGRYHPGWVGHRTMVATARELQRFWSRPPSAFMDPANLVTLDVETHGLFTRLSYGLGVLADPASPIGLIIGHGGGGPGYSAAAFAAPEHGALAIVLEASENFQAQPLAVRLLQAAVRDQQDRRRG
jgi:D-alanyl-D-alanine carboxypeptidase